MNKPKPIKMHVMSIVHGQSEYRICSSIKSNLRLKHEIIARDRGKTSIQITSVLDVLNDSRFQSYRSFIRNYGDVESKKSLLVNFRLFIIMDVDDCTPEQKQQFISKNMFKNHWLYKYIVPIYSDPNLEAAMKEAGIRIERKKDYFTIFPTNHSDLDIDIAHDLLAKLNQCQCSNIKKYIEYCLQIVEGQAC